MGIGMTFSATMKLVLQLKKNIKIIGNEIDYFGIFLIY